MKEIHNNDSNKKILCGKLFDESLAQVWIFYNKKNRSIKKKIFVINFLNLFRIFYDFKL